MNENEKKHGYWWIVRGGQNTEGVYTGMGLKEIGYRNGEYFHIPLITVEAYDEHDKPGVETFESVRYFAKL